MQPAKANSFQRFTDYHNMEAQLQFRAESLMRVRPVLPHTTNQPQLRLTPPSQIIKSWSSTDPEVITISHVWTIKKFRLRKDKVGEALESCTFPRWSHGCQDGTYSPGTDKTTWKLKLYPKGRDQASRYCWSLFLELVSSDKREVHVLFELSVLNATQEKIKNFQDTCTFVVGGQFVSHKAIEKNFFLEANKALPNDTLTIHCELSVLCSEKTNFFQSDEIKVSKCRLSRDFGHLLEDKKLCDVTICVDGKEMGAHQAVLSARSPVFAAMFEHNMQEKVQKQVEITDMNYDVLRQMLKFIYTGHTPGLDYMAEDLLAAADKYGLERLKELCEKSLSLKISVETACQMLDIADMHNAQQLKTHAIRFINAHATEIMKTTGWVSLVGKHPHLIAEAYLALHSISDKERGVDKDVINGGRFLEKGDTS